MYKSKYVKKHKKHTWRNDRSRTDWCWLLKCTANSKIAGKSFNWLMLAISFNWVRNCSKSSTVDANEYIDIERGNVGGNSRWLIHGSKPITFGDAFSMNQIKWRIWRKTSIRKSLFVSSNLHAFPSADSFVFATSACVSLIFDNRSSDKLIILETFSCCVAFNKEIPISLYTKLKIKASKIWSLT